jgi:predicted alpha/beta hydrolase
VLQGYYRSFATHFSTLGYTVYTFDYSGIGKSGSGIAALKENTTTLRGWGQTDQAAVVSYAHAQEPGNKIILVTHSVGGQILGFNPNYPYVDKIVMVASQSGYWKYYKGIHLPKMWLFWYILIPCTTFIYGYFPARRFGLFENLPKSMVLEWMKWGKKKAYMMAFQNPSEYFYDKISIPLLSLSFPNDPYAPRKAVDWLTDTYCNAQTTRIHYSPGVNDIKHLRHFGFFRKRFKESLWNMVDEWIQKP